MNPTRQSKHLRPADQFAFGLAKAARERSAQRDSATHTVAGNARDVPDFVRLVSMLGLDDMLEGPTRLGTTLCGYVRRVADAIGVPPEATGYEVSDTATAYLALSQRWIERPDRELMLAWDERLGWYVGVETAPAEPPVVVGYLGGDAVQSPAAVARFVADAVAGRSTTLVRPVLPPVSRAALAARIESLGAPDTP
ncbi:DUF6292 family protein [Actinophytocola sp.]|uniref:DUF6292 family protein n=1 Tax=Actinophytocola sp. TaxID=1872138 RepID=UPI003D6A61BD